MTRGERRRIRKRLVGIILDRIPQEFVPLLAHQRIDPFADHMFDRLAHILNGVNGMLLRIDRERYRQFDAQLSACCCGTSCIGNYLPVDCSSLGGHPKSGTCPGTVCP
jgi:hypothetical protein